MLLDHPSCSLTVVYMFISSSLTRLGLYQYHSAQGFRPAETWSGGRVSMFPFGTLCTLGATARRAASTLPWPGVPWPFPRYVLSAITLFRTCTRWCLQTRISTPLRITHSRNSSTSSCHTTPRAWEWATSWTTSTILPELLAPYRVCKRLGYSTRFWPSRVACHPFGQCCTFGLARTVALRFAWTTSSTWQFPRDKRTKSTTAFGAMWPGSQYSL